MMIAKSQQPLRGILTYSEPMSKHTSWRVGGVADQYYRPADIDDLSIFISQLPSQEPITWLGLGSNLLVRDGGLRGTVIAHSGVLNGLQRLEGNRVRAEAGVSCAKVARFCARQGLCDAEFFAGIPGTIGGALAMNAGAFGGETWSIVAAVETLHRWGKRYDRMPDEYEIGYRRVQGPIDEWFIAAEFELNSGDSEQSLLRIKSLLARRNESQPIALPNAGSVFRNPVADHAARLIEACGLKGACVGGACISTKHANFIINTGNATATDVESLIKNIVATVKREHGVDLEREVRIVGEPL